MNKFEQLGFTEMDLFIFFLCAVFGLLGAGIDYILKRDDFISLPLIEPIQMPWTRWLPLLLGRLEIGFVSGGIVWLLLSGGLEQNKENLCRLLLISFTAGFACPSIASQYRGKITKSLTSLIDKQG